MFKQYSDFLFYAFIAVEPFENATSLRFHFNHGFSRVGVFEAPHFQGVDGYRSHLMLKG